MAARLAPHYQGNESRSRVARGYRRSGMRFHELPTLIPEIDIWRAAQLMLKRYSNNTLDESAARANDFSAGRR